MEPTFDKIVQDIRDRLVTGAASRKSPLHTQVVATSDCDMRVMVLREFDAEKRRMRFHTDARSPKVDLIRNSPEMSVLAYDADAKVQIRMRGFGTVETAGPEVDAVWQEATNFAKRCYLAEAGPSSISEQPTSGLPAWAEGINPTNEQVVAARENFAVLYVTIKEFDWLYLANDGHRRARVTYALDGSDWSAEWLVP